jgi:hypothetical protein
MDFLRWGNLPLHQLGQKQRSILDDKDIAEEIKAQMAENTREGFLKAEDIMDLVASPRMQQIFTEKGISKASISTKTVLRWLEKLG